MGVSETSQVRTQEEILALTKLIHRLEEEAASTNNEYFRRTQKSSKTLLLVQQASKAVDAMLAALSSFIDTDDRTFLGFARDNNAQTWAIRKVM